GRDLAVLDHVRRVALCRQHGCRHSDQRDHAERTDCLHHWPPPERFLSSSAYWSSRTAGANASSTLPGSPPWKPGYPDPMNTIPLATVGPPEASDPPCAATPLTVVKSCAESNCQSSWPVFDDTARTMPSP